MASIDSNEVTNVEVQNENDISTSEIIQINNDQNLNTSTIAKVGKETVVSSDLFAYDPAEYSFCKERSIVNILKVGESGVFKFLSEIRDGVHSIAIWPKSADPDYIKLVDQVQMAMPETTQWNNRRPNIGDFVFGKTLNRGWHRGYVVSILPNLRMAMVDEAEIMHVGILATCKKPLCDMYAYTGLCELTDPLLDIIVEEELQFKVIGQTDKENPDEFEILFHTGQRELKGIVKPWIPLPEQLGIPCAEVPSGSTVCVTGYRNHVMLYVRPLDTLGLARYNFIMETIAKAAETSPFVKILSIGETVLALSADGNYYRAYLNDDEGETLEVIYHDLGRSEKVDRRKLKIYPQYLAKLGYCVAKVTLRDVPIQVPPYMSMLEILDNLVENKVPLTLTYDGLPNKEGVYLKYPDGESVNDMICNTIV